MPFDRNQTSFASFTHRYIWDKGLLLMPPEYSLQNMHDDRRGAFLDLYNFLDDAYSDMYGNPSGYCIDWEGIEEQIHGSTWRKAMVSAKHNRQKERLRILEGLKRTDLPKVLVERIMKHMDIHDSRCVIEKAVFDKEIIGRIKTNYKRTGDEILRLFEHMGVRTQYSDTYVILTSERYSRMFEALLEWNNLLEANKSSARKYRYNSAFFCLDHRIFRSDYTNTLESSLWYMSDEVIGYMSQINELLESMGLNMKKPDNSNTLSLGCDYKGEHLVYFAIDCTYPIIRTCMFKNGSQEFYHFQEVVKSLPNSRDIKDFCLKGLNRCRKCGCHPIHPSKLGYWTEIFGKQVNLCGGRRCFETSEFTQESCDILKTLIKINYDIIRGKAKP